MSLLDDFDDNQVEAEVDEPLMDEFLNNVSAPVQIQDEEKPMFSLEKVEYKPSGLKYMAVSNNLLVMALAPAPPHIIRLNLASPEDLEDIEISRRTDDHIHKLFLDPTGTHLVISMESEENYYINSAWKKPKQLPKLKGYVMDSIAWDAQSIESGSSNIMVLIGTSKGKILETIIEATEKRMVDVLGGNQPIVKTLYNLNERMPITGLKLERFPPTPSEGNKFFIMATTPTRIFQFIGGPTFEQLFLNYEGNPGFHELPGTLQRSELVFFSKFQQQGFQGLPKSFVWLTEPGLYHGDLVFGSQNPGDKVTTDTSLLPYIKKDPKGIPLPALSITLTEFHFLLLYEDRLQAICKLNAKVIFEHEFNPRLVRLRGIAHDQTKATIWIYGEQVVYELAVQNEERDVWQLYLEKELFEMALMYCKEPNAREKKEKVWTAQAEYYFKQGKYDLAANYFGKTQRGFEEVTLRFISLNESGGRDALKTYLIQKLDNLKPKDATQRTIICTWLTEIFVNKLNILRDAQNIPLAVRQATLSDLQDEFRHFLSTHKDSLNPATTFHIISSHGCIDELLHYATVIEDFERVISHHIQHQNYKPALDLLAKLGPNHEDVFYKFSPVLMHYAPRETVEVWLRASFLTPRKLIPALMRYVPSEKPNEPNQAIRYLQKCVGALHNTDPAIHNYLLSLYAKQKDPTPLLNFINSPEKHFDLKYALRLCTKEEKLQACVLIYSAMGLYEEAVDLALKVDIELAKFNADKPEDDDSLRKKLWLRIARHVVKERKDIKEAMAFLNHCNLLKIEDILPFFPDFVLIDSFKEEICKSLEEYNKHIEELKTEMDDATRSADLIRLDIKELRNKYGFVAAGQKCGKCGYPVLTSQFYLFPCHHVFHSECLIGEMMSHLNAVQRARVRELQNKISVDRSAASSAPSLAASTDDVQAVVAAPDLMKTEFDEMVAAECIFCGDIMIRSVDRPFVADDEFDLRSWTI